MLGKMLKGKIISCAGATKTVKNLDGTKLIVPYLKSKLEFLLDYPSIKDFNEGIYNTLYRDNVPFDMVNFPFQIDDFNLLLERQEKAVGSEEMEMINLGNFMANMTNIRVKVNSNIPIFTVSFNIVSGNFKTFFNQLNQDIFFTLKKGFEIE